MKNLSFGFFLISIVVGCGPLGSEQSALRAVNQGEKVYQNELPDCLNSNADFHVQGQVLGFEIVDKKGINFGFNLLNQFFEALGLAITAERGQMIFSLDLSEEHSPDQILSTDIGRGESLRSEFRFHLDVVKLKADLNYFRQTPLSQLVERAIRDTFQNLSRRIDADQIPWKSKIVYSSGDSLIIPIGLTGGVDVGDSFYVTNIEHVWAGPACASQHLLEKKETELPLAEAVAVQVEPGAALLQIYRHNGQGKVKLGARVELRERSPGNGVHRRLSRLLSFAPIRSLPLTLTDGSKLDVTPYITEQFKKVAPDYGFNLTQSGTSH